MREHRGQQHVELVCKAAVLGPLCYCLHSKESTEQGVCLPLSSGCLFIRHTACLLSTYAGARH